MDYTVIVWEVRTVRTGRRMRVNAHSEGAAVEYAKQGAGEVLATLKEAPALAVQTEVVYDK